MRKLRPTFKECIGLQFAKPSLRCLQVTSVPAAASLKAASTSGPSGWGACEGEVNVAPAQMQFVQRQSSHGQLPPSGLQCRRWLFVRSQLFCSHCGEDVC